MRKRAIAAFAMVVVVHGTAWAQSPASDADRIRARQVITTMEGILANAITNGAQMVMAQVRTVMPMDRPRLSGTPRVNGVRLENYGVLFNVQVPGLLLPIMWDMRQVVQENQNRQLATELERARASLAVAQGLEREIIERRILFLEQQLGMVNVRGDAGGRTVSAQSLPIVPVGGQQQQPVDPRVIEDPQDAYTREVKAALIDAMLQNSQAFSIGADEWMTIVARDAAESNPLFPGDSIDISTWVMRVKGSVLASLRSGAITLEEARKQVEVREQ